MLNLNLRFRVHALMLALEEQRLAGVIELTPGIRSLQLHYDNQRLSQEALIDCLRSLEDELPGTNELKVPTRIIHLPLSWDDPATRGAIEKYSQLVRKDAPWAPSNIEFIRRINGLASIEAVKSIVFDASYLVLGLGDVYLGAPVATPIDPRHRLVTTKYNPARTWTPENAVGIGGAYMCVYGMEGPGGYQFVGRTIQLFSRFRQTPEFEVGKPWLLRFFDQIRFFPVSADELLEMRDAFAAGRYRLRIEDETFDLGAYNEFLDREQDTISAFKQQQQRAFEEERQRWEEQGQLNFTGEAEVVTAKPKKFPAGMLALESPVAGSVWKVERQAGEAIKQGDRILVLESMKMEMNVLATLDGRLATLEVVPGQAIAAGQVLALIEPSGGHS